MTSSIRFKFRAELSYSNLPFDGHYITVGELKRLIAEKKGLGIDAANELQLTDATSKRDYDNDAEQVLKNSAVIVKRVAGAARPKTIVSSTATAVTAPAQAAAPLPSMLPADLGIQPHDDEFGEDPLSKAAAVQHEEQQMLAFLNQAAKGVGLEGQLALQSAAGRGRGRGRGFGTGAGRGGRGMMMNRECNRCGQLGHFWSECPTQGDPAFDREKRKKVPSGIPASKIQRNADGSLYLPDGELGELAANTQAFNKLAALMGRGPAVADSSPNPADGANAGASGSQVLALPAHAPAWQQPGRAAALEAAARSSAATQQQQLQQQSMPKQEAAATLPPTGFADTTPPPDAASADIAPSGVERDSPAAVAPSPVLDTALPETKPAGGQERSSMEPQLFDDDFDDGAKHLTHMQPVKLALGMMDDPARRSLSPVPPRPSGPREGGIVAAADDALAPGRGRGYEDADDDGVPAALRRVGCSRLQLEQALPFLRGLLPGAMTMADVFRAFGSGRPLTRREFQDLQSAASRPGSHRGSRREIVPSGRHLDGSERRDRDPHSGKISDRERGRRSRSRGRRSKRSRSGGSRSRSRSRSPSSSKRRRGRSELDDPDRSRGRDRERSRSRDRERSRGRDYERARDKDRERERVRPRDAGRHKDRERDDVRREAYKDKDVSPSGQPRVAEVRRKRSRSPPVVDGGKGGSATGIGVAGAKDPDGIAREKVKTERQTPTGVLAEKVSLPILQPADLPLWDADGGGGEGPGVPVSSSARRVGADIAATRTASSVSKDGVGPGGRPDGIGNDELATDKMGRRSRSASPNRCCSIVNPCARRLKVALCALGVLLRHLRGLLEAESHPAYREQCSHIGMTMLVRSALLQHQRTTACMFLASAQSQHPCLQSLHALAPHQPSNTRIQCVRARISCPFIFQCAPSSHLHLINRLCQRGYSPSDLIVVTVTAVKAKAPASRLGYYESSGCNFSNHPQTCTPVQAGLLSNRARLELVHEETGCRLVVACMFKERKLLGEEGRRN